MSMHSRLTFVTSGIACAVAPRVALAAGKGAGIAPDVALARLVRGNKAYVTKMTGSRVNTIEERAQLGNGQAPWASILTCADSRTAPEILFNQGLGDIFVDRVAGNFPSSAEVASLEYASAVLGSQLIVVMGHSACGAIEAAIKYSKGEAMPSEDLTKLVQVLQPAVKRAKTMHGDLLANAVKANAVMGAEKLRSNAVLSSVREKHDLKIVAAYCDPQRARSRGSEPSRDATGRIVTFGCLSENDVRLPAPQSRFASAISPAGWASTNPPSRITWRSFAMPAS